MGEELAMTQVDADGNWHMSVNCASEKLPTLSFQLNGAPATPTINQTGADQAEISLTSPATPCPTSHARRLRPWPTRATR